MNLKTYLLGFLACLLLSCTEKAKEKESVIKKKTETLYTDLDEDSVFLSKNPEKIKLAESLMQMKRQIDSTIIRKHKDIMVYAKLKGQKELFLVEDFNRWPKDIEITYNIIKSNSDDIGYIEEIPYSESGEWDNIYTHYFDKEGRTMIFEFSSTFYSPECSDAALNELSTYYFDESFNVVRKDYSVKALSGQKIDPQKCNFKYRFDYNIHADIKELQAIYHFKDLK